jgi:hypothetical protein
MLQKHPLKPIVRGGGQCDQRAADVSRNSCGGVTRGTCNRKNSCECEEGWTGPHCLAAVGFDPIAWDPPDKISDVGFVSPGFFPKGLLGGLLVLMVVLLVSMYCKPRMEEWTPIPDVEAKMLR